MADIAAEAEKIVTDAERVIVEMCGGDYDKGFDANTLKKPKITTTQLRKFLTAVNALTNKITAFRTKDPKRKTLAPELAAEVKYLKVKIAYQAGRELAVREFMERARMEERVDRIGDSLEEYQKFARFMEALVAYHKFYGGGE